ncbi:MAG: hypothetical protein IIV59_03155, partial [Selenomonadaceae bacterium]|nr:hypothetical protein [Selenomonadaceae bacterium]
RTADNDICNVKYVVEADPNRAAAAREIFGCETVSDYRAQDTKSNMSNMHSMNNIGNIGNMGKMDITSNTRG